MKVTKKTVTIKVEVMEIASIPNLLGHMIKHVMSTCPFECLDGSLTFSDGDRIEWKTESKDFEI